jgi:hypothetical protein
VTSDQFLGDHVGVVDEICLCSHFNSRGPKVHPNSWDLTSTSGLPCVSKTGALGQDCGDMVVVLTRTSQLLLTFSIAFLIIQNYVFIGLAVYLLPYL